MSFPNYKTKGFWFFKWKVPDGWEDLGKVPTFPPPQSILGGLKIKQVHAFCKATIHLGRQGDQMFKFCPLCKGEVEELKTLNTPTTGKE